MLTRKEIRRWPGLVMPYVSLALFVLAMVYAWRWWGTDGAAKFANLLTAEGRDIERLGQTGDIFGGVSALFAALAFSVVAVGGYFQHRTWLLAERQHTQQAFEPLFFQLVSLHREVARNMELRVTDAVNCRRLTPILIFSAPSSKPVPFDNAMEDLRQAILKDVNWSAADSGGEQLRTIYLELYDLNEEVLGPYFRSLYHVFKLIDQSGLESVDKVRYANIARSTLARNDIFILALNGMTELGKEFKPLIERFGLLKHVSKRSEPDRHAAEDHYSKTATMSADERQNSAGSLIP